MRPPALFSISAIDPRRRYSISWCRSTTRFRWVRSPTSQELTQLAQTIAHRVSRFLERQGLLERDAENSYLTTDAVPEDSMNQLLGHSMM